MAFRQVADRAAHKVAFGFITRQMHPQLREPVEELLDRGYGVLKFGETSTTLVREGWFGERQITVMVKDDQVRIERN
ncbi:MAG: hypothetical protein KC613_26805 [Myxococcales bacterium]|nr:hypothetical protein [Myxococcales bacterium]MCB9523476.1 hypothetical protein [Myxococcales bacterium]